MSTLVLVELTRLRWRRAVLVLLTAMVVVPLLIAGSAVLQQSPAPADAAQQARAAADREVAACLAAPEDPYYSVAPEEAEELCPAFYGDPQFYLDYDTLDLAEARSESGLAVAVVLGLIALLVGTTFVGHDWNTGSMSNQLLFEPRRLRVWSAKALAVTLVAGVVALLGATAFWLVLASRFWFADAAIPDGVLLDGLQQGWRGAGVAALGALGGFALTMLSRSTVFTLGALFGVSVAGGILIGLVVDDPGWVDPTINVRAVVDHGTTYYVEPPESCFTAGSDYDDLPPECEGELPRSLGEGLTYVLLLSGVVAAASAASYRRRDVP